MLMIPTLNEEEAIEELLLEAQAVGFSNILVVDGFSRDHTREVAERSGAEVILQNFGKGKGCGIRTGLKEFLHRNAGLLCVIDGDRSNDPAYLTDMITLAKSGEAEVVLGSRIRGRRENDAMNWLTFASNLVVSFLLGAKFRRLFTDVQTGYWVFTRNAVESIRANLKATGFEIEFEIFVNALRHGLKVCEVPVGFRRRRGHTKFSFVLRMRNLYYAFRFLAS